MTKPRHRKDETGHIIKVDDSSVVIEPRQQIKDSKKLVDFFRCSNIGSTLKAGFKSRPDHGRAVLYGVVLCFGLIEFVTNGERLLDVIYIREKFPYDTYQEFQNWYVDIEQQ